MTSIKDNTIFDKTSFLEGSNSSFIEELYLKYINNPENVPQSWREFFDGLDEDQKIIQTEIQGPSWSPKKNNISKIIDKIPESKIILYNFEKLCGYKFSINCVEELVKKFPDQIVGVKDSSYNLYENLKIENFSVLPGSELKLIKGLELGCTGIITATCNVTAPLARQVYDDFFNK